MLLWFKLHGLAWHDRKRANKFYKGREIGMLSSFLFPFFFFILSSIPSCFQLKIIIKIWLQGLLFIYFLFIIIFISLWGERSHFHFHFLEKKWEIFRNFNTSCVFISSLLAIYAKEIGLEAPNGTNPQSPTLCCRLCPSTTSCKASQEMAEHPKSEVLPGGHDLQGFPGPGGIDPELLIAG